MTVAPLRIGIDARELLGRPTGVGRYLAELLARWTRDPAMAGCTLELYAPGDLDRGAGWAGAGGARLVIDHVPGVPGTWWEQWQLQRHVAARAPSVLFAPAYTMPLVLRVPRVVAIHDVSFAAHPEWFPRRQALRRKLVAAASGKRACRVLTLTDFSRREIIARLGVSAEKIQVIPPAVDTHPAFVAARTPVSPGAPRPPLALFVGSIFNRRHVPEMIAAFAEAARDVPGARLEIVGENRTFPCQPLDAVVAACGATGRVIVRDYVDDATLQALFEAARVFVFLSEYEGFGLTPLEAMARGVPAVVLDTPVAREVYGDGALYVARPDGPELVSTIARVLQDDAWHTGRAEAGRAVAAGYSWDRTARETLAALTACAR